MRHFPVHGLCPERKGYLGLTMRKQPVIPRQQMPHLKPMLRADWSSGRLPCWLLAQLSSLTDWVIYAIAVQCVGDRGLEFYSAHDVPVILLCR